MVPGLSGTPMSQRVRDVCFHPSGRTAIATVLGYLIILAIMTAVLFGGAYLLFLVFG